MQKHLPSIVLAALIALSVICGSYLFLFLPQVLNAVIGAVGGVFVVMFAVPLTCYIVFHKHMSPVVFADDSLGSYGIRKPHLARGIVCFFGIVVGTLIDAVLAFVRAKLGKKDQLLGVLYRRVVTHIPVSDPVAAQKEIKCGADGKVLPRCREAASQFIAERTTVAAALLQKLGWRRCFIRYIAEMPTPEVSGGMRKTQFVLY